MWLRRFRVLGSRGIGTENTGKTMENERLKQVKLGVQATNFRESEEIFAFYEKHKKELNGTALLILISKLQNRLKEERMNMPRDDFFQQKAKPCMAIYNDLQKKIDYQEIPPNIALSVIFKTLYMPSCKLRYHVSLSPLLPYLTTNRCETWIKVGEAYAGGEGKKVTPENRREFCKLLAEKLNKHEDLKALSFRLLLFLSKIMGRMSQDWDWRELTQVVESNFLTKEFPAHWLPKLMLAILHNEHFSEQVTKRTLNIIQKNIELIRLHRLLPLLRAQSDLPTGRKPLTSIYNLVYQKCLSVVESPSLTSREVIDCFDGLALANLPRPLESTQIAKASLRFVPNLPFRNFLSCLLYIANMCVEDVDVYRMYGERFVDSFVKEAKAWMMHVHRELPATQDGCIEAYKTAQGLMNVNKSQLPSLNVLPNPQLEETWAEKKKKITSKSTAKLFSKLLNAYHAFLLFTWNNRKHADMSSIRELCTEATEMLNDYAKKYKEDIVCDRTQNAPRLTLFNQFLKNLFPDEKLELQVPCKNFENRLLHIRPQNLYGEVMKYFVSRPDFFEIKTMHNGFPVDAVYKPTQQPIIVNGNFFSFKYLGYIDGYLSLAQMLMRRANQQVIILHKTYLKRILPQNDSKKLPLLVLSKHLDRVFKIA